MKNITALIILALIIQTGAYSQSCLVNGININSQVEIDSFQFNYPTCTEIEGSVLICGSENNNITNLNGLSVLTSIGGYLVISDNIELNNFSGLENLSFIGGDLEIYGNEALTNIEALINVNSIGGYIKISHNNSLTSFEGLNNVNSIGGKLYISNNNVLETFNALENIPEIKGIFVIYYNPKLTSFNGLTNVNSIDGSVFIKDNELLTSLLELENLTSINGMLIIDNNKLTSLEGLENIIPESISDIRIVHNDLLTTCEVKSVCDYLSNPNGSLIFADNALGCNSIAEVSNACMVGVSDNNTEPVFTIYPNPAKKHLSISSKNNRLIDLVIIYNQLGQKVLHQTNVDNKINISTLKQGIYIIELTSKELITREKLIIEY